MKRTITGGAAVAVTAALALTGCSGGSPAAQETIDPNEEVTLTVSVWNLEQTPEFQALFDAFENAHPNITIEPVDVLADDYPEKITTMLSAGDTTDVITMKNAIDYARYATRGQLQNVSDLAEGYGDKLAGLETFDSDGEYYALPYRQDFWVLYYNKGLFDSAGLDYPDNISWDEYADLAQKLTDDSGPQKVYGTYHHYWRGVVQAISAAQTGGDLLSGDYDFMTDQYDLALTLQEDGDALDYATAKTQQISYRTMFETGQTAMMPMGTWYIAGIKQSLDEGTSDIDWGVAQMPQLESGGDVTTFGSPTAFAVNKNAKNTAAAKMFIDFAAGEEGAKAIAAIGVVPAFSSDAVLEAFSALPADELSAEAFSGEKKVVPEMPVGDNTADISTILDQEHDLIMVGEISVQDGLDEAGDRVKSEVID